MKTNPGHLCFLSLLAVGACLTSAGAALAAIDPPSASAALRVRVTSGNDYKDFGFGKLNGTGVRAADGKQFGTIRDLIIDARTGEPKFVVVSGGGFARMGGRDRVLPYEALMREPNGKDFLTRLQRVDWELLPEIQKADIDEGRLVLTTQQRRHVGQLRDQRWAQTFDGLATNDANPGVKRYEFASAIIDKPLYGEDERVGKVEDLYIDPRGGPVQAIVNVDQDYVGAQHQYLVPLQALQVAAGKHARVHTTLAADDFREVAGVRVDRDPNVPREERRWVRVKDRKDMRRDTDRPVNGARDSRVDLAPAPATTATRLPGDYRASDDRVTASGLDEAVRTVRERWNADPDLNRRGLRVSSDRGRLLLEGTVPTPRLAEQAEDTARRVTSGMTIENRIRIEDTRR